MAKKPRKEGWIIPGREKLAQVIGSGSNAALDQFVGNFLSIYILMVGISPAVAAVVLLVLKAWDAINDMIVGYLVDKYRFTPGKNWFTRWFFSGRYMPWFRILFMLIPLGTIILFNISTELPMWLRITQYCLGYFLFDFGMNSRSAYTLLPMSTTNNFEERNFLLAWTGLGNGIGSLPVLFLGTTMVAGSVGYGGASVVFAVLGVILALVPALFVKERNDVEFGQSAQEKITIKDMVQTIGKIPELLLFLLGVLLWGIFYTSGYGLFVSYYIFENASLSIIMTLFSVLPPLVLVPFLPMIFKRVDKIVVARVTCSVFAVTGLLVCLAGPQFMKNNFGLMLLAAALQGGSYSLTLFACSQLTPDIAEMAKFRTGRNVNGIVAASYNFVTKLVNSAVSSVTLLILSFYGFQSVEAASFEELAALNAQGIGLQTERALEGLWNVSYLFPLIGFAAAAVAFCFVKIPRSKVKIYMQANSGQITHEEAEEALKNTK